jgi:Ser/Thr protein kinase RdoA (MazF antagonist)
LTSLTSKERIDYIQETIIALKNASLPVISAISNDDGENFSIVKNRTVQVYPYIKGSDFQYKPEQIKSSAKILNKFHTALKTFKTGPLPTDCVYPSNENLEKRFQRLNKNKGNFSNSQFKRIESLYFMIIENCANENTTDLAKTIIHDDWHWGNLLYHQDGSVAVILDFDNMQHGERIYDIAYAMYSLYKKTTAFKSNQMPLLFLKEYGELLPGEKRFLPLAIAQVCLFIILWSAENFRNQFDSYLKNSEKLIYFLQDMVYDDFLS